MNAWAASDVPEDAAAAARLADRLADEADALEYAERGSPRALDAAERSVAVAEELLRRGETVPALSRAARAWWRHTSTLGHTYQRPDQLPGVIPGARRCAELGLAAIRRTPADDPGYGALVATFALQLSVVISALSSTGHGEEAAGLYGAAREAAARGSGPGIEHAQARLTAFGLEALVDVAAEARIKDRL